MEYIHDYFGDFWEDIKKIIAGCWNHILIPIFDDTIDFLSSIKTLEQFSKVVLFFLPSLFIISLVFVLYWLYSRKT